jgi:DNA-binding MarR family transcriptional regulator
VVTDEPGGEPHGADLGWELSTAVVLFHEAIARRLGLSAVEHKALGLITRAGSLTAGELAQQTELSPGAATGLIDRLEDAGYVQRQRDPADRRRVVVMPVPSQRPDLSEIFADLTEAMNAVIDKYDHSEALMIHDYIVNTIAVLKEQTRRLSGT